MKSSQIRPIILSAGKGNRLNQTTNKSLLSIAGKPAIQWTTKTLKKAKLPDPIIVIRADDHNTPKKLSQINHLKVVKDPFCLGTGGSLYVGTMPLLNTSTSTILVLYSDDSFLYTPQTIKDFIASHQKSSSPMSIMTLKIPLISDIGGLKRDKQQNPCGFYFIDELERLKKQHTEIICGAFLFNLNWLKNHFHLMSIGLNHEYLLTSLIAIAHQEKTPASSFELKDPHQWCGVNTQADLKKARRLKQKQLKNHA